MAVLPSAAKKTEYIELALQYLEKGVLTGVKAQCCGLHPPEGAPKRGGRAEKG